MISPPLEKGETSCNSNSVASRIYAMVSSMEKPSQPRDTANAGNSRVRMNWIPAPIGASQTPTLSLHLTELSIGSYFPLTNLTGGAKYLFYAKNSKKNSLFCVPFSVASASYQESTKLATLFANLITAAESQP